MKSGLEYMEADGDGKARSALLLMQRFDFIITLVTIEDVLQSLLPLTTILQTKNVTSWRQQRKQSLSAPSYNKTSYNKRAQIQMCGIHDYMKALWNWQRNSTFNRASHDGKQRHHKYFPADTPCQH